MEFVTSDQTLMEWILGGALLASAAYAAVRLALLVCWSSRDRGKGSDANNGRR
jgi:hypothetical protein